MFKDIFFKTFKESLEIEKLKSASFDLNLATLKSLKGSSEKALETILILLSFRSFIPPKGSYNFPDSSLAIAFIVMSLLFKSSLSETLDFVLKEKFL